jgi:hypothetical protein
MKLKMMSIHQFDIRALQAKVVLQRTFRVEVERIPFAFTQTIQLGTVYYP